MKIYLDMCCLKRPFDDQAATRVQVETQAVEAILVLCRDGGHELIDSAALRFENTRNPNADRKAFADDLLDLARHWCPNSESIEQRAVEWQAVGINLLDALHLASAEAAGAEAFATVDDVLLKKATRGKTPVRIAHVLDLFKELVP